MVTLQFPLSFSVYPVDLCGAVSMQRMRQADHSEWHRRGGVFIRQVQRHAVHDGL